MSKNDPFFIKGADISTLQQIEDFGGRFYHEGREMNCLDILKDHGFDCIRLKVWNEPGLPDSDPAGYNDKRHVLEMARRVHAAGLKLMLNFHYSDFWADPGKQTKPKQWAGLSFHELSAAVYDYTREVITDLRNQGTLPAMAQIGNEITNGFLWDDGRLDGMSATDAQWARFVELLRSGLAGLRDGLDQGQSMQSMIHIDRGGDKKTSRYFLDNLLARGVDFDIIGQSYYSEWHGPLDGLRDNLHDLALAYDQEIILVETAYPWTTAQNKTDQNKARQYLADYPLSVEGQAAFLRDVITIVKDIPRGKGRGLFYWEPGFITVDGAGWKYGEGNEWANMTLFDFDGRALDSMDVFALACISALK